MDLKLRSDQLRPLPPPPSLPAPSCPPAAQATSGRLLLSSNVAEHLWFEAGGILMKTKLRESPIIQCAVGHRFMCAKSSMDSKCEVEAPKGGGNFNVCGSESFTEGT